MSNDLKPNYKNKKTDISYREVLTSPWLGAIDFDESEDTIVVLEHAFTASAKFDKGREDTCVFARFKGYDKDIVINATNAKQIHKFTGTPNVGEWKNVPLQIYVDSNVEAFGKTTSGWRIRPKKPKLSKPKLTESHGQWGNVVGKLAKSETTIETVRKHFDVSQADADKLMSEAMNEAPTTEES